MTAVVAAMRAEIAPLCAGAIRPGGMREASVHGADVLLAVSGVGASRARQTASRLLAQRRPAALLVLGVGGGLEPGLTCGTLIVAERLLDDRTALPAPDPQLVARAVRAGATRGTVVSAPRILCTAADKARARAAAGLSGPAVVDLESAAFARQAAAAGVPCVIVRAVCDPAEEDLPLDFNAFDDGKGGIDRWAVGRSALRHPARIGQLLDLRRRVGRCAAILAGFTARFLAEARA